MLVAQCLICLFKWMMVNLLRYYCCHIFLKLFFEWIIGTLQSLLAETGQQFLTINFLVFNCFKDTGQQSSSDSSSGDSDTESSSSTESEAFLKFPQASSQVGNDDDDDAGGDDADDAGGDDADDADDDGDDADAEIYFNLPSSLVELRSKLLRGYTTPAECPDTATAPRVLTSSEMLTLKHYIAWKKSNGTVLAYKLHAEVLQSANVEILTLYNAQELAATLTALNPLKVDMCPRSCIAYTGEFEDMDSCPYICAGKICGEPHYQTKHKAWNKP
jgi:hypothetical protein